LLGFLLSSLLAGDSLLLSLISPTIIMNAKLTVIFAKTSNAWQ